MAQEGIYKNPVVLNSDTHKNVKIAKVTNYSFAQELNSMLLTGHEFVSASKHYPIVFISGKNDDIVPVAILSLREKGNLFVNGSGKWSEGAYIPGFLRRYPFVLAESDASGQNFAVTADSTYEGFDAEEGVSLFDEEGAPSDELNKIVEFLKQYQLQNLQTQEMIKKLIEYNLLKDFAADVTLPFGEKIGFRGMKMVDEKALLELDDEKALDLFRRGFLGWIYGHLYSLANFRVLAALETKKPTVPGVV